MMVKCDFPGCDEKIEYLPFKCKYCAGVFCKTHRLPENHECTFEMRSPIQKSYSDTSVPTPVPKNNNNLYGSSIPEEEDEGRLEEEMEQFIKRQERLEKERARSQTRGGRGFQPNRGSRLSSLISHSNSTKTTYWLMGLNVVFFIFLYIYPQYILLNVYNFSRNYQIQTLLTAMFVPGSIISLIFSLLILYWTGKMVEYQYGSRFLLLLYVFCGILGGVAGLLIQFISQYIPYFSVLYFRLFASQSAVTTGLIAFMCYNIGLEREMRFYLFFIPVRLKAKHIILIMIIMSLLWGLLGPDVGQLASLFGIPAAKLLFDNVRSRTVDQNRLFL